MYCNKCGQELREGARFCPRCGSRFVYSDNRIPHAENISQEPDGYRGDLNSAPVKKPDTGKKSKRVVFLIVGICAAAAIFAGVMIFLSLNSGTTPQKVYKKYFKALEQDRDKVVSFEQDKGVNGVAVTDINGTGIADILYMTDSSDGVYLHTLTDSDTDIETDTDNDISGAVKGSETIFRTSDDDSIYILNDDGVIKTSCAEDNNGNMVTTTRILAQRTTDDESGDYVYMILADSGYLETADKEEYDKFIEDIRSKNVTVIITTLTDDQLADLFPAVDDNISVSCDDALKKLKDNDIAPVGAGETVSSENKTVSETKTTETKTPDTEPPTEAPTEEPAEEVDVASTDWSAIYESFIQNNKDSIRWSDSTFSITDDTPMALHDFDMDGTPELAVGYAAARLGLSVYTISDGEVVYTGGIGGRGKFYSDNELYHGIFVSDSWNGERVIAYVGLSGTELVHETVIDDVYDQNTKDFNRTIGNETLYEVYLDCTVDIQGDNVYRQAKNDLKLYKWSEIESNGWNSFIAYFGY